MLKADGTPLPAFNGGQPVRTQVYANVHPGAPSYAQVRAAARGPAYARDRGHRRRPRAGDRGLCGRARVCLERRRQRGPGLPGPARPGSKSAPALRTRENHIKRGFIASPTLGDLHRRPRPRDRRARARPARLRLEWPGRPASGLPEQARGSRARRCGDHQHAALGNIAGDARPEIVVPTAEFDPDPTAPGRPRGRSTCRGPPRRRHEHPRERPRRQRAHLRARGERGGPARLADQAERRGAGRASAGRPGRGPRAGQRRRRPAARGDRQRRDG